MEFANRFALILSGFVGPHSLSKAMPPPSEPAIFANAPFLVDHQIGRVLETLERIGELDNTLIFVTADNGASGEGGLAGTFNETYVLNGLQTPFGDPPSEWVRTGAAILLYRWQPR